MRDAGTPAAPLDHYGAPRVEFAMPRPRPLHEWIMSQTPTATIWPVLDPDTDTRSSGAVGRPCAPLTSSEG